MAQLLMLIIALLVSSCQAWVLPLRQQQAQQSYLSNTNIRPAVEADLDDITTVIIDAFAPGPMWQYVFQFQDQYKEYQWNCTRETAGQQFGHKDNTSFANVISVPIDHTTAVSDGGAEERAVALAVWRIIEPETDESGGNGMDVLGLGCGSAKCSDHLDANMTRALDFNFQFLAAERHYIYGLHQKQLHLGLLGTHPDFDGHGYGAAHCHWGIEIAKEMGVPVTLVATPAGWPLYDSLGFESVANITIKTLDESDDLWFEYMRYDT